LSINEKQVTLHYFNLLLKDNLNFESLLPRFNAILNLSEFDLKKVNKNTRNKINKGIRKGLTLKKADKFGIDILYSLVQKKYPKKEFYFKDKFNIFNKDDSIDLFLVSIDSKQYLLNSQNKYHEELNTNNELNNLISTKFDSNLINKKMNSDRALTAYKNDITEATKLLNEEEIFIAGALVIKYKNRIIFEVTGFDNLYSQFAPNYFLHYAILNYYQKDYQFANLNGVSGDFENETYKLSIDLKPALSEEQLDDRILRDFSLDLNKAIKNILPSLLPKSLIVTVLDRARIDASKPVNSITKEERARLVDALKNLEFTVTSLAPKEEAIITAGGVDVSQVNPSTMESKIIKGLYFAGEVLDIDAETGGYNLQIAWSTGYKAGLCAAKEGVDETKSFKRCYICGKFAGNYK